MCKTIPNKQHINQTNKQQQILSNQFSQHSQKFIFNPNLQQPSFSSENNENKVIEKKSIAPHKKSFQKRKTKKLYKESKYKMIMRLKKQAKYSSLETLSMFMLKDKNIFNESKDIAKSNGISQHKNYSIIAMRLGILFNHLISQEKTTSDHAIKQIFDYLQNNLQVCLQRKYSHNNPQVFIKMVRSKTLLDISVFKRVFQSNMSFQTVCFILRDLYDPKKDQSFSQKNLRHIVIVAKIIIEAAKHGKNLQLVSQEPEKRSPIELHLNLQNSNKSYPDNLIQNLIQKSASQKKLLNEQLVDLVSPSSIERYKIKQSEIVLEYENIDEQTVTGTKESILDSIN